MEKRHKQDKQDRKNDPAFTRRGPRTCGAQVRRGGVVRCGVWDLLIWAFRRECARLDFDEVGSETGARHFSIEHVLIERARIGCRIDGGGRSDPHPDADIVASAVAALPIGCGGRAMALRIAQAARSGLVPDWMDGAQPRLMPVEVRTNRYGTWARTRDSRELGEAGWPHQERRGRKGNVIREAVLYCPAMWVPSQATIAAARRDYLRWWSALLEIRTTLQSGCLSGVVLTDEMPPRTPWSKKSEKIP